MKAITVRQPWAWAIVQGDPPKDVENRTNIGTWRGLEGQRVAIHAGKGWSDRGSFSPLVRASAAWSHGHAYALRHKVTWHGRPMHPFVGGAVIGTVTIAEVHGQAPGCCTSLWAETEYFDADKRRRTGLAHLVLLDPRPCEPIDVTGRLGAWTVPDDVAAELEVTAR